MTKQFLCLLYFLCSVPFSLAVLIVVLLTIDGPAGVAQLRVETMAFGRGDPSIGTSESLVHANSGLLGLEPPGLRARQLSASDAAADPDLLPTLNLIDGRLGIPCPGCIRRRGCAHCHSAKQAQYFDLHQNLRRVHSLRVRTLILIDRRPRKRLNARERTSVPVYWCRFPRCTYCPSNPRPGGAGY
jgi:hypothetical protein